MEAVTENTDEQRGGATVETGDNESIGSGYVERLADGESHIGRLSTDDGAEGGTLRAEEAVVDSEENAARDAGKGGGINFHGISDGEERDLRSRNRDLQLTMKLGDAVEDDARAVAKSLTALLTSLKSALSEVTGRSVEHMRSENEAAGQVQDSAIDAATKGNRFINECLRLNEEMKGMNRVATQLESLKQRVDQFERQSNRYLPRY